MQGRIRPSKAAGKVHYAIREVVVLAKKLEAEGRRILYLNIGDPNAYDYDLAPIAIEAGCKALRSAKNGYANSLGLEEAIEAILKDAKERQGISSALGAFTGNGASECIDLCITALVDPSDNILLPCPTYPLYSAILNRLGVEARYYKLDEAKAWEPDVEHMASLIDANTRAVVVINPNNPTGSVYSKETLLRIADLAKSHNLLVFNDEIYDRLILDKDKEHCCLASLEPELSVVTFNGLSKSFLGPGLRVGWGVYSGIRENLHDYIEAVNRLLRSRLSASHPMQYAIAPCLQEPSTHLTGFIDSLKERRDLCIKRIAQIPGLSCQSPAGSFYAFVRVEGESDDKAWCRRLLEEHGVVVVPGSGFGYTEANAVYFRIVFLPPLEILNEAFDKIAKYMQD
ncbi:MAG: aminotransferase class I/II-fold pyridoxal phosphate-dependent enzyme [Bradymonadales bacterium]